METVKIGIIGCGGIANGKHMPALKKVRGCEMVAFCDIELERAQKAAEKYGAEGAKVYTDYKELLADNNIDTVHICTPNLLHSPMTVDALYAGKNVMCEKPMAINAVEAKKMLDAAEKTGKVLTIGYQNRQRPDAQYLKKEADKGRFGDIYYGEAIALRRRAVPTWGVFLNEEMQGGGPLIDIGTHALDLTLWTMDNWEPAYAVGTTYHKLNNQTETGNAWGDWDPEKFSVEDSAFGFVVMKNGATIILRSSWALNISNPMEAKTTIAGTKAGADMLHGLQINGINNGRQYIEKPSFEGGGVDYFEGDDGNDEAFCEAKQWIRALQTGTEPCVLPYQAYTTTRILDAIYESSKTGKPVYFED